MLPTFGRAKIAALREPRVGQVCRSRSSVRKLAKKLSAMALSRALPTAPMLTEPTI